MAKARGCSNDTISVYFARNATQTMWQQYGTECLYGT